MKTPITPQNYDITPGEDKFATVNNSLLRLHIDDLSQPIRRSTYAPPANRRPNDTVAASLLTALAILVTVGVAVYFTR